MSEFKPGDRVKIYSPSNQLLMYEGLQRGATGTVRRLIAGMVRVEIDGTGSQDSEGHNSYSDFQPNELNLLTTPEKPQGAAAVPPSDEDSNISLKERSIAKDLKCPPRVVGIWRNNTFFVNDLSRVCEFDEVNLIDIRDHQQLLDAAVKAARAEARAEAIGEALDLIDRDQGNGILLCVTLDELRDLSDAAREKTV